MTNILYNNPVDPVNIDEIIKIKFFSANLSEKSNLNHNQECKHIGTLVKNGFNTTSTHKTQRYRCIKCGKRFGSYVNEWELETYQFRLKQLVYELLFENCSQLNMEKRWGIPQPKLSKFKHEFVETIIEQNPNLLQSPRIDLPKGVIYGDETYLGKRGNSNTEILFTNDKFEVLSTGIGKKNNLEQSIVETFFNIPEEYREKMLALVTDGESSYQTAAMLSDHKVILIQQYHAKKRLGEITIHKYKKFGPHLLHFLIHTHWKIFKQGKHELGFHWEKKLIKGKLPIGRGRPTNQMKKSKEYILWRQKLDEYNSPLFQKTSSARVFINPDSKKISMRKGSEKWMQLIFDQLIKIFNGKCITNNRSESKNSQMKRTGNMRKQPNEEHSDNLFKLQEYIVKNGHIPVTYIKNRPLYKYLMESATKVKKGYKIAVNNRYITQTLLETFL